MKTDTGVIGYFGTDLRNAGHYIWELYPDGKWSYKSLSFPVFNPEWLHFKGAAKGDAHFIHFDEYSIWFVAGSPVDTRPGTKSVFWVKGLVSPMGFMEVLLSHPAAKEILKGISPVIKWKVPENPLTHERNKL